MKIRFGLAKRILRSVKYESCMVWKLSVENVGGKVIGGKLAPGGNVTVLFPQTGNTSYRRKSYYCLLIIGSQ